MPVLLLAALMAAACGHSGHGQSAPTTAPSTSTTPGSGPTPASQPSPASLKPVLAGIVLINDLPTAAEVPVTGGVALSVNWADLQPAQGGPIAANNAIDQAISQIRSINQSQHVSLGLRLRILAGINAPDWAKNLGGPPVNVFVAQDNRGGTAPRFWTDAFGQAYDDLQRKLAARYDSVPEVREVTASRCTTVYAEPMIRQVTNAATRSSLEVSGYSDAQDDTCQLQMIDAHQVWQHTRTGVAFNPYQHLGGDIEDTATTMRYMQYCRKQLGLRCVLENNSIRWPPIPAYETMYQAMSQMGPPISFQTAGPARVGDLAMTLSWAVQQRANAVELTPGMLTSVLGVLPSVVQGLRSHTGGT